MGSKSDWATMKKTAEVLDRFGVAYEKKVVSAHRTPDLMFQHAEEARSRGIKVLFALRLLSVEDQAIATALADFAEEQGKIAEESSNELI